MSWQWERVGKGEGGWWERRSTQGSYHVVWASVCSEGLAPAGDACGVEGPWWPAVQSLLLGQEASVG